MKLFKVVTYTEHWLTLLSARQFILAQNWRATFYTSISPLKTPKRPDRLQTEMHAEVRMRRMLARQTLDALPDFSIGASGISFKQTVVVVDECRVTEFCHHQDTSKPEVFFTPLTCTPSGFARTKSCRRPSFGLSPRL